MIINDFCYLTSYKYIRVQFRIEVSILLRTNISVFKAFLKGPWGSISFVLYFY